MYIVLLLLDPGLLYSITELFLHFTLTTKLQKNNIRINRYIIIIFFVEKISLLLLNLAEDLQNLADK